MISLPLRILAMYDSKISLKSDFLKLIHCRIEETPMHLNLKILSKPKWYNMTAFYMGNNVFF